MYSKTQAAFILSGLKLFDAFPRIYFWTFTFVDVSPDWWYPAAWNAFSKDLQNWFGFQVVGLRVLEIHPAEYSHGLHYHALLNKRVSVHVVRHIGKKYGFGRIEVEQADRGSVYYLSKYLAKNTGRLAPGMRRWGTIGGFRQVKKSSIIIDSAFHRNMKKLHHGRKVEFETVTEVLRLSKAWGDIQDWPKPKEKRFYYEKKFLTKSDGSGTILGQSFSPETAKPLAETQRLSGSVAES